MNDLFFPDTELTKAIDKVFVDDRRTISFPNLLFELIGLNLLPGTTLGEKKAMLEDAIDGINSEAVHRSGCPKIIIKRGYGGGFVLNLEYLASISKKNDEMPEPDSDKIKARVGSKFETRKKAPSSEEKDEMRAKSDPISAIQEKKSPKVKKSDPFPITIEYSNSEKTFEFIRVREHEKETIRTALAGITMYVDVIQRIVSDSDC